MKDTSLNSFRFLTYLLMTIITATTLVGCSNDRRLQNGKPLKGKTPAGLLNKLEKTELVYEWLSMRTKVEAKIGDEKKSFKTTIRIKKDSLIAISISPALGVEIVKVIITRDSVKYISKIPGDKHYYMGDFKGINNQLEGDFNYDMIQNILTGEPVELNRKDDKLKSNIEGREYLIVQKYNRKLKRVTGINEREMDFNVDTIFADTTDRRTNRILNRSDEKDLLIKRYWLDGLTYKLTKTIFNDLYSNRTLEITHEDYKEKESQLFPFLSRLVITDPFQSQEIKAETTKIKFDKPYEVTFNVPEKFERRYYY